MTAPDERIERERAARRKRLYIHAAVRGGERYDHDADHWCDFCVGFYGVPHDGIHKQPCRNPPDQCACIECAVRWNQRYCFFRDPSHLQDTETR